jgi:hypothetical protein
MSENRTLYGLYCESTMYTGLKQYAQWKQVNHPILTLSFASRGTSSALTTSYPWSPLR